MTEKENVALHAARAIVPRDHPCFAGHFPGHPILPGVLLLERVLSLAIVSLGKPLNECSLSNIKFLSAVEPGDELDLQLVSLNPNDYKFTVHIAQTGIAAGRLACSGQLRISQKAM